MIVQSPKPDHLGTSSCDFSCIPFSSLVLLPPAFLELHEGLKAKVNRPTLGCRACVKHYIERCGQILAPHLSKEDIIATARHFTHPRVFREGCVENIVQAGIDRRLGNRHA